MTQRSTDAANRFPVRFRFGCATSAYQVEGAAQIDGRGPSIWDAFAHQPGRVAGGHHGDVAVDHYHRYREDVALMRRLGLHAYRFSISWPRVLPQGDGAPNAAGLDFYSRLTDELLEQGIEPWPTLFHWDLPQALEDRYGGWTSRETVDRFADYAALVAGHLADRVTRFFTVNELTCFTDAGYAAGVFAPGRRLDRAGRNQVRHHGLLAHGHAVRAVREQAGPTARVGIAENPRICVPVLETAEHVAAARVAMREINAPFLTAILEGRYLDAYLAAEGDAAPRFTDAELEIIGSPLDFVGLNIYAPTYVRAADDGWAEVPKPPSHPRMDVDWLFFDPRIAYWAPRHLSEIWGIDEVHVSENGCACRDEPGPDGRVLDTDRVLYLREHLREGLRAIEEGWPLASWFVWSLLDNFEWEQGYAKRFGIVHVDYATLERTPKLSAEFLREVIARRALV